MEYTESHERADTAFLCGVAYARADEAARILTIVKAAVNKTVYLEIEREVNG